MLALNILSKPRLTSIEDGLCSGEVVGVRLRVGLVGCSINGTVSAHAGNHNVCLLRELHELVRVLEAPRDGAHTELVELRRLFRRTYQSGYGEAGALRMATHTRYATISTCCPEQ